MMPQIKRRPAARACRSSIANDNSLFIDRSVKDVYRTIAEAIAAGGAGDLRVPAHAARVDHPAGDDPGQSLIGAFALMALARLHHQHADPAGPGAGDRPGGGRRDRDAGEHLPPHRGGHGRRSRRRSRARSEIGFAVVAMTLTLAAVYAPLAFTPGRTGRLFIEFALTLAGAVLVSGFVALTLSPMMCSQLLQAQPQARTGSTAHGARRALIVRPDAALRTAARSSRALRHRGARARRSRGS